MDSEDERLIEAIESDDANVAYGKHVRCLQLHTEWADHDTTELKHVQRGVPELRLDHAQERDILAYLKRGGNHDNRHIVEWLAVFRIPRFFSTIRGFHTGTLDLLGRHKPRYDSLIRRWKELYHDLQPFPRVKLVVEDVDEETTAPNPYEQIPTELIRAFEKRWRVNAESYFMISMTIASADKLASFLLETPEPIFQQRCLQHLPPELLHYTVEFMDHESVRYLGSTSRLFRQISITYIYRHRSLVLKSIQLQNTTPSTPDEEMAEGMKWAILAAKERLLEQMQTIIDNPGMLEAIRSLDLFIGTRMPHDGLSIAGIGEGSDERRQYFGTLLASLGVILNEAVNIQTLRIINWDLSPDLVPIILSLPLLRSIKLMNSRIWPGEITSYPPSPVLNAHFILDSRKEIRMWRLLTGMPRLRVLSISRTETDDGSLLPPVAFRNVTNPFKTVERFFASCPCSTEVDQFSSWIRSAKVTYGKLRLTHFKIAADSVGLYVVQIGALLDALSGAPMRHFSLEGIHNANPQLLDKIADAFPDLESLALHYRHSLRQSRTRSAWWPAPTWHYAQVLHRLPKLKHFIWNQTVNVLEAPSYILLRMEDGWPTVPDDEPLFDEVEMFFGWDSVAKLFASYAPSLETIAFVVTTGVPILHYTITRGPGGIACTPSQPSIRDKIISLDPLTFSRTWEEVNTPAREEE
ncbi:hypothetical protein BXZ70DRAFT_1009773 [Cristinia sonorae]|uniref:F-box domain-containing protein n=1 Tax=Cristinia sonorae TaxID=1940300 RepID=A0A8K0ULU6_9AGAR|nr:hypothetical protein BXZ70DRAFT_1009773 [Cristinia sonorae]